MTKKIIKRLKWRRPPLYVPIDRLFLDTNNPRLPEEIQGKKEPELMFVLLKKFNLEELADSMAENGYFDEEPLVAIPKRLPKKLQGVEPDNQEYINFINDNNTEFTVVEGNRRVATVKLLLDEGLRGKLGVRGWPELSDEVKKNLAMLPVIIYPVRDEVVPYLGVRHIIGIQKWDAYERASYIAKMVKGGRQLSVIQQQIGDRRGSARKIYFCYKLIGQVEEEFGIDTQRAKNYFSYLVLSTGQNPTRDFLGIPRSWENVNYEQPVPDDKVENLKFLFSWLFGEGKEKPPVIRESRDITNKLTAILRNQEAVAHLKLTRDLDDAYERSDGERELLLKNLKNANKNLERSLGLVPQYKIEEVKNEVSRCLETVNAILKLLEE